MATTTPYYGATLPDGTDRADVNVLNNNTTLWDLELHNESVRAAANIANIYDATATYTVGDFCTYLGVLYKCTTDTASPAGAFDGTEWEQVNATDATVSWDSMNMLGAKNLIPYPYYESTETDRGITYTNNDDGTVTISAGTPTSGSNHILVTHITKYQPLEKNTKYILSCGYDGNEAYLRLQFYRNGSASATFSTSSGVVTIDTTGYTFDALQIQIFVTSTLSNDITFYPMLRLASVKDTTYAPYAMTNKKLTNTVDELKEENDDIWESNNVLGSKNLLPYPYYDGNLRETNGITFTANADGSVTVSGTATANAVYRFRNKDYLDRFLTPGKSYTFTGCPSGASDSTYKMEFYTKLSDDSNLQNIQVTSSDGVTVTISDTSYYGIYCRITILSGTAINTPITFYPMVRPAEYQDDTYTPYAMTNKDLTNIVKCSETTAGTYTLQATVASNGAVTYEWVSTT